jgi:F-type H+-transporting ATPase subunit a
MSVDAQAEAAHEVVASHAPTASEYITHHLTNWQNQMHTGILDFSVWHYDSVFWAVFMGLVGIVGLWLVSRRATSGVPGRTQAAIEILFEMVDTQAKSMIHSAASRRFVAPLALTVFVWVFLMNAVDFLPLDLIPGLWSMIYESAGGDPHHAYMRPVATGDLSITMGLSVGVLLICLYYNVKIKGAGGWAHELVSAPFGSSKNPLLAVVMGVVNFSMQMVEFAAKTISHGMRLFGNMFAGELIFMLIAMLGGAWAATGTTAALWLVHVVLGLAWTMFHVLVIPLQAFIFMMLTLVYIGQAHDAH